ncbi:MAG: hypothetical protein IKB81_04175 [Paludibacteraceae bacterium]|nr:hypothetical protein [Paludibacteraceae bacterium]
MNLKRYIVLICASVMAMGMWAQNATSSPSSRFGYGELNSNLPGAYRAMGGVGIGMRTNKAINPAQPASYTGCDSLTFMFDIAGSLLYTNYGDANGQRNKVNGNLEYITMQFPLWRRYVAMSLGVTPYSAVGYNFALVDSINSDYFFSKSYRGQGGFTQVYGGLSANICDWVALGVNAYYMFGDIEQIRSLNFTDASIDSLQQVERLTANSLRLRYGVQLFHTFGKHTVTLGGIFENKQPFSRMNYEHQETTTRDTISMIDSGFEMPMVYGAGLSYGYDNRLLIGVDYMCQDWSNVLYFGEKGSLHKSHRMAVGAEYRNDPMSRKYVNAIYWRLGAHYTTAYTDQYNQAEVGVSMGIGFPLKTVGTVINTTVEYGRRGLTQGVLNENYLRLVINASISEHWFFKRKL